MLKNEDEGEDHDPVDETDLDGTHPWIVLYIHDLLQLTVALLHLHARLSDMKIDAVKNCALLNYKIVHVLEQVTQVIHLRDDIVNLLFLNLRKGRVSFFDLLLNHFLLLLALIVLPVKFTVLRQSDLTLDTVELADFMNVIAFDLSEPLCSIFQLAEVSLLNVFTDHLLTSLTSLQRHLFARLLELCIRPLQVAVDGVTEYGDL